MYGMYWIYGMYWMMNVVAGTEGTPQAVLFRGLREVSGPGRLTRLIGVDRSFYGEDLVSSERIWIEPSQNYLSLETTITKTARYITSKTRHCTPLDIRFV